MINTQQLLYLYATEQSHYILQLTFPNVSWMKMLEFQINFQVQKHDIPVFV